jgi:hypothetical protein
MPIKVTRSVVCHRPEQSAFHIAGDVPSAPGNHQSSAGQPR